MSTSAVPSGHSPKSKLKLTPVERRASATLSQQVRASADAREGVAAFAERREPVWRGE